MPALLRAWPWLLALCLAWPAYAAHPPELRWQLWEDPLGGRDSMVAWQSEHFRPLSPSRLNPGFSASVFWLRSQLHNPAPTAQHYWLALDNPRLEDVQLSVRQRGDDGPGIARVAGWRYPMSWREVSANVVVFPVEIPAGTTVEFMLRVESRSAVSLTSALWHPLEFREQETEHQQLQALMLGMLCSVAMYALIQGLVRHDTVFTLFSLWLFSFVLHTMVFMGHGYRYFWPQGGPEVVRLTGVMGAMTAMLFMLLSMSFLHFKQTLPQWMYRQAWALAGILLALILWMGLGDYRMASSALSLAMLLGNVTWLLPVALACIRRVPNARLFGLSVLVFWLAGIQWQLVLLGMLPPPSMLSSAMLWLYNISLAVTLLIGVTSRSMQLQRDHERTQRILLEIQSRQQSQLERAVVDRTRELRNALIAAEAANLAKNDFLARVSHDLRTPLTAIMGYADMIQAAGRADAPRGGIIRRSANHLLALIDDLIDYARGTSQGDILHPTPIYLHALIDAVAAEAETLASKQSNRFIVDVRNLPGIVSVDAKRLQQILQNLLANAAKFTHNGAIRLTVRSSQPKPGFVKIKFNVSDTGPGIALEDQARIFQPFERLPSAGRSPGLGLGLAIAAQWAERMNARITVRSRPGHGTTFVLSLTVPLAREDELPSHRLVDNHNVLSHLDGQGRTLLIAEDNADIRDMLSAELESHGFQVVSCADGQQAIEHILHRRLPLPDLILTDLQMPRADGLAVLASAREHAPWLPVLLLSATPPGEDSGFDASLLKPVSIAQLLHTLGQLLGLHASDSARPPVAELHAPCPPAEYLVGLAPLIDMGAISDLADWADQFAHQHPDWQAFADQVRQYADHADLGQLRALVQRCQQRE